MTAMLLAFLLVGAEPTHAPAAKHPEIVLSEDYAPIVWLAEDEPLHPMLPHAFAFDDTDNNQPPDTIDLADVGEITGTFSNPSVLRKRQAQRLRGTLDAAPEDKESPHVKAMLMDTMAYLEETALKLPPPTVLYYGPAAHGDPVARTKARDSDVKDLRAGSVPKVLRDAAQRAGIAIAADPAAATLYERIGDDEREWYLGEDARGRDAIVSLTDDHHFEVRVGPTCRFEYWFYYLYDQGLNGHLHDSEHAFVFVDPLVVPKHHDVCKATAAAMQDGVATTAPLVRAVVGAGHEAHTANNILVASPKRPQASGADVMDARHNLVFPPGLPFHMPILVELGKHASAPDRSFDGRFDFGMDANVFPESVWGTRDVQSGNVGRLKLERFENWFAFPRSERGILMPAGWRSRPEYESAFPQQIQYLIKRPIRAYRLVPVTDLRDLYERLVWVDHGGGQRKDVADFLQAHRNCFWDTTDNVPDPVVVTPDALAAMVAAWTPTQPKRDVWSHADHTAPDSIFKLSMFRRFSLGAVGRVESGHWAFGPSIQIAQISLPAGIPLVGGSMLFNDSTLNLQGLFGRSTGSDETSLLSVGVLVNSFRGRYFGWYAGGDWRRSIADGCCRLGGGIAGSVPSLPGLRSVSFTARIGLLGDPFRRGSDDPSSPGDPIAAIFSLEFVAGLGGVKHPLSY